MVGKAEDPLLLLFILPRWAPGKIPQTFFTPTKKEVPSETGDEGSRVSSRGMWVRS